MKVHHILNLGAGVQSTTLYLMDLRGDLLPWAEEHFRLADRHDIADALDGRRFLFDHAIFADTQEEPKAVYDHLQWLKSLDGPPIIEATAGKLGDDLMRGRDSRGGRFASIPCYTMLPGAEREGQTRRQCTKEYKIEVIERAIRRDILGLQPRQRIPAGAYVHHYMGLSFDEPGRIISVKARYQAIPWAEPHFPLFEMEMSRRGCLAYLDEAAPGRSVPRSACVFCPYRRNDEWRRLRDTDPEGWARAVAIDEALRMPGVVANRTMDAAMYLHRSCKPLRSAPIDTPESRGEQYQFGFAAECEGMCGL